MQELTEKEEVYCQRRVEGATMLEAFQDAFPQSLRWKRTTIDPRASKLEKTDKIRTRIRELRTDLQRALAEKGLWTREQSVERLARIAQESEDEKAVVAAVREINSMNGFNAPKEVKVTGISDAILAGLNRLNGTSDDADD